MSPPRVLRLPLPGTHTLLLAVEGRVAQPSEGLLQVRSFVPGEDGALVAPAQAHSGRWGLLRADATWCVEPQFEQIDGFSAGEGLALTRHEGRFGYIDKRGRLAIEPRFRGARSFAAGRAGVQVGETEWRLIDATGAFVSRSRVHDMRVFDPDSGLARAWQVVGMLRRRRCMGFIDRDGHWAIEPRFDAVLPFGPGGSAPAKEDGKLYGLIDRDGAWVLPPTYQSIREFNDDGLAHFLSHSAWHWKYGYLDAAGRVVIEPGDCISERMACGIACSFYDGSHYVRADGSPLVKPPLSYGTDFRAEGGYAVARRAEPDGVWGMLRTNGDFVDVPAGVREPVLDDYGWVEAPQVGTPLGAFLTDYRGIAWLDVEGRVAWRADYDGSRATVSDAHAQVLWRSDAIDSCWAPASFFHAPLDAYLQGTASFDGIADVAGDLLEHVETCVHAFANAEAFPDFATGNDDDKDDIDDDLSLRRRVLRIYLDAAHYGPYQFLADQQYKQLVAAFVLACEALTRRYGAPDPAPSPADNGERIRTWLAPLRKPLAGDHDGPKSAGALSLSIYTHSDSGDGDLWRELWLWAGPENDVLEQADAAHERNGSTQTRESG